MLGLKTKKELATDAHTLSQSFNLVRYRNVTYIPADFETLSPAPPPAPERTIWLPLNRESLRLMAHDQFMTLFGSDSELAAFDFMVAQQARLHREEASTLLIRTEAGLKQLTEEGKLEEPAGPFVPNYVQPMLNTNQDDLLEMKQVLEEWVDSEEEANSLLAHLATILAPGWSAVKYVLFLGEGRNGKGVLLKMLAGLFGAENISHVTRQHISEQNPVVTELNGKLLNLIYDGQAEYLKDSGAEKSLVAGEPVPIRKLYESTPTIVQTNALFVEALNREPKSSDKSIALQKRLVRFQFPNVYPLNRKFEKRMLSEPMLGALLALLIEQYVLEDDLAQRLAPTSRATELQVEHMFINSMGLQFLKHFDLIDPLGIDGLIGVTIEELVAQFKAWRTKENDSGTWSEPDVVTLFNPLIEIERQSKRINGNPRKIRVVGSLKPEAQSFINSLKEEEDAELLEAVVDGE